MQRLMRMTGPCGAAWNVIKIVNPFDFEGDVAAAFNKGKVSPLVRYAGQIDQMAFIQRHAGFPHSFYGSVRSS